MPGSHRPRPQHRGARSPPPSVVVRERHTAPNLHSLPMRAQRWQALSRRQAAPQLPPALLFSPKASPHCSAPPSQSVGLSLLGTCELARISAREGQCLPPGGWDSCGVRSPSSPQGRPLHAAEVSRLLSGPREAVLVPQCHRPRCSVTVWFCFQGLESEYEEEGQLLGQFTYDQEGESLQMFHMLVSPCAVMLTSGPESPACLVPAGPADINTPAQSV